MQVFPFPSKSEPGVTHHVTVYDDGRIECNATTCRGYRYSKTTPQSCTHTKEVMKSLETGKPISKTLTNTFDAPVRPQLASPLPEDLTVDDYYPDEWVLEEKFDGHRRLVHVLDPQTIQAYSRAGLKVDLPAHILEMCRRLAPGVYDGEQLIVGGTATDVRALDKQDDAKLVLFDVLQTEGNSTLELPTAERRLVLEVASRMVSGAVSLATQFRPSRTTLSMIWARGGEGAILKELSAPYRPGKRAKSWVKFKKFFHTEMTVVGFDPGELGEFSRILVVDDNQVPTAVKSLNDAWRATFAAKGEAAFIGERLVVEHQGKTAFSYRSPMADHFVKEGLV